MNKLILLMCIIIFQASVNAANISNTKGLFTLKCGDYTVDVSQDCKYTMASVKWKDYKIIPISGYNGTVLVYPTGMVGCGHSEGGLFEDIKSFSISADGVEFQPESGKTYTAGKFVMKKVSMLANLQLTGEIEINNKEIKVTRDVLATDVQDIKNLYIFMFCFSNKFKDWYAKELDGKSVEGSFTDGEKFLMNTDVKWAAMFDPAEGKGVGFVYSGEAKGKDKKTTFWDRKVYHKFYLFLDIPAKVEKGFSSGPKTVIVRSFAAEKSDWKSIAEAILSK